MKGSAEPLAQQIADARDVAEILAETIEVMLEQPERAEEVGRDSLVAYRHVRLDWSLQP